MYKKNCITSTICAAIFAFFLYECTSLSVSAAYWPRMICIVGLTLSVIEIVTEAIKWKRSNEKQEKMWVLTAEQTKRGAVMLGVLILWIIGLDSLGFLVSSLLALCAISLYFEPHRTKRNIIRDIVSCVFIGVAIYFLFGYLGIHFPKALLM